MKVQIVSASRGDIVPNGIEISSPHSPVTWEVLPAAIREWAAAKGYLSDDSELIYALRADQETPEGFPVVMAEVPNAPIYPDAGSTIPGQEGYVVGECLHRVARSEWRAGFRVCERCPKPRKPTSQAIIQLRLALGQGGRVPRTRGPVIEELKGLGLIEPSGGFRFALTAAGRAYIEQYDPADESTFIPRG